MARRAADPTQATDHNKSERLGLGSFELSTEESYSQKKFRTAFIRAADNLEQDLANSLYKEAFFQFVRLVWSQYPQAIPPPISGSLEDKEFLSELERVINNFSATPYNTDSESIHPAFIELLLPVFMREREHFINSPRGVLTRELFRPIREAIESTSPTFPDWSTLLTINEGEPLREILINWSQRWNLDADWCRDYAVAALWEWLKDRFLQYQMKWDEGRLSLREATFALGVENVWTALTYPPFASGLEEDILPSLLIKDFKFSWKGLAFQHHRWNPLSSYKDEWKQDCEESFKTYLAKLDRENYATPVGVVRKFLTVRGKYVQEVERAAKQAGLVKTPRRWANEKHLTWTVRFQVQNWPLSKIEKTYSVARKTVSDGIKRTLCFIGLPRRSNLPAGMPKGTRPRTARRIVRN